MAEPTNVAELQKRVTALLAFDRAKLLKRSEWGTITFEKGELNFHRVFDIANSLRVLPVELLTDATVAQITEALNQVHQFVLQINLFSLENSGNPTAVRDQYLNQLQASADVLFTHASPWIPFLAYQQGDVSKNISNLNASVAKANSMIGEAKKEIEEKRKEIDTIIIQAREASASAGAAVFTEDFSRQATNLEGQASKWLISTATFGAATLTASVVFFSSDKIRH